jgi:hypothetical protein
MPSTALSIPTGQLRVVRSNATTTLFGGCVTTTSLIDKSCLCFISEQQYLLVRMQREHQSYFISRVAEQHLHRLEELDRTPLRLGLELPVLDVLEIGLLMLTTMNAII